MNLIFLISFQSNKNLLVNSQAPVAPQLAHGVFYGSHGSGMIAIPKRSKNIPHKSTIADFLEYFIFW